MADTLVQTTITVFLENYRTSVEMANFLTGLPILILAFQWVSHDIAKICGNSILYFTLNNICMTYWKKAT